ncbi:uncharacterized protein LOC110275593 [Arachis duranensis]|uniref:Uncharacterized protein LOC110275593 n=1 Tax=Arachis duranensis TaxID=130453 RepID=A0A6P5MS82_ARADU|nr:uncharacterized protein LOC110275593 [Arachis duranensis]
MASDESFVALMHYRGSIKKKTRSGIKFTDKDPLSVFLKPSTSFAEFKSTILRRLGLHGVKRVEKLFYRAVSLSPSVFEVRTSELLAELVDVASSSGGSNRNMHSTGYVASSSALPVGSSSAVPVFAPEPDLVASPLFAVNLNRSCDALVGEAGPLGDGDFAAPSSPPCVPVIGEVAAPKGVEDALQDDDDDDDDVELATIAADDSEEETPRTTQPADGGASNSRGVSEFQVGQQFQDKEEVVLSVKTYIIRRGVEYKVLESDHRKYYGKCKEFGSGADAATSIKVLQNATEAHFGFRPTYKKVWMAKQKDVAQIYGDWDNSYNELPRWVLGLQITMPESVAMLRTSPVRVGGQLDDSTAYFHRLFWTFQPCVEAF